MNQLTFGIPTEHRYARLRDVFKILKMLLGEVSGFEEPANFNGRGDPSDLATPI